MLGKYEIEIYNRRVHYYLSVKRNLTVIQGNSATGKTELIRMLSDYENNGNSSGITEICEKRCVVIDNAFWKEKLRSLSQCIIFIDEGASFLRSQEFAEMVKGSDNYFVLITRDRLDQLPYSIEEIYGMRLAREQQKYNIAKRVYNELYQIYNLKTEQTFCPTEVITEDSNSGHDFFKSIYGDICHSAHGKSNILARLQSSPAKKILTIVDGAAFGPEMANVMRYIQDTKKIVVLYAPESFEYLILKANILSHPSSVTEETWQWADSKEYFSWEEFYTDYLTRYSADTVYQYHKHKLKDIYMTSGVKKKIVSQLPKQLRLP